MVFKDAPNLMEAKHKIISRTPRLHETVLQSFVASPPKSNEPNKETTSNLDHLATLQTCLCHAYPSLKNPQSDGLILTQVCNFKRSSIYPKQERLMLLCVRFNLPQRVLS